MVKDLNIETVGPFRALYNALTPDECTHLYTCVRHENMDDKGKEIVSHIAEQAKHYNEEVLNFNVDFDKPDVHMWDAYEGESRITLSPDHGIHAGNILNDNIFKVSVIVNISSRDDVQGGELTFKNWAPPPRVDNFGAVIAEKAEHQPTWTNEQGTVIFYPSMEQNGYQLVTSGPIKRLKIYFRGGAFK